MSRRRWLRLKLRTLFDRRRLGRELADELAAHVEMETEAGVARGLSPREARRRALASFGGVERIRHETREQWSFRWLDDLVLDLRHAARGLMREPGTMAVIVLSSTHREPRASPECTFSKQRSASGGRWKQRLGTA